MFDAPSGEGVRLDREPGRNRDDPSVYEALRVDRAIPVDDETRALALIDLQRPSRRLLLPFARVLSLVLVFCIRCVKRVLPSFSWHRGIDGLCIWFMRRFVSAEAGALLMRHFVVETNLIAFVARNCGGRGDVVEPTLRPTTLEGLGDSAVMRHDVNVYNLVIDVGRSQRADVERARPPPELDFSSLHVPPLDAEAARKRWLELDIQTALYLMNIPFSLFTTEREYERAVNSFQLDESLLAYIANLTGDPVFRTWTPLKFPLFLHVGRDVPRELFWHACVNEYAHTRLCKLRDRVASNVRS